jgi:hypothetical protein
LRKRWISVPQHEALQRVRDAGPKMQSSDHRMDKVTRRVIRQSTPEGFKAYFLSKANGNKQLAQELEAKLLEDIRNAPEIHGSSSTTGRAHSATD